MTWMRRRLRGMLSERGAAMVEFGLVLPVLMLIMCATIDFGLAVYTLNNLTAAVREGGRYAATIPAPGPLANDATVRDRVYNYIGNTGNTGLSATTIKTTKIFVSMDNATSIITVQIIGYPYKPMTPLAPLLGLSTINLNRTAIFRWERAS